ncbi:hypothetical protein C8Q77DRAFT_1113597 [Trametes polyzona]|nr:hypothetical protein C8Q77DRAFT_1113597 [Trametes polyzona]
MGCEGRIIESPYLPSMYDHELHPQHAPIPPEFCGNVLIHVPSVLRSGDGLITFDAAAYHPGATRALRAIFADWDSELKLASSRPVVYAGPLVSGRHGWRTPPNANKEQSPLQDNLGAFLDKQLRERGERSVLLVSFGSMFWPSDPAKLGAVLDVLVETNVPFVMSCASPFAAIPDETKRKVDAYSSAFLSQWVPQQSVLEHKATGWCMSHAGHNTVLECITAGVPMILWPIDADQAQNAVHLTDTLRIAYELLEVRHGAGLGPIRRLQDRTPSGTLDAVRAEAQKVLAQAFGEDGMEKRERLRNVQAELAAAWQDGGIARAEVEAFLEEL